MRYGEKLSDSSSLTFPYSPDSRNRERIDGRPPGWRDEKQLEYAIVRLILLGVIKDYVKDYNGKTFELVLSRDWESCRDDTSALRDYMVSHFEGYVRRYQVRLNGYGETGIHRSNTIEDIERATATALVKYVYDQIERKRRQASRQMLELARKGVSDPDAFREELMLYLQASEKFTNDLEGLVRVDDALGWKDLVDRVDSPDEFKELHGACSRVLESYPTHPGLLCVSAVTRLAPSPDEVRLSEEEFRAALRYTTDAYGLPEAKALGDTVAAVSAEADLGLAEGLQSVFGVWLLNHGRHEEAVERFFLTKRVRDYWLTDILRKARQELPITIGM